MRKKDKLYTVNRWNTPVFMVDREHNNIFDGLTFGQSSLMTPSSGGLNTSTIGLDSNRFGGSNYKAPIMTSYVNWDSPTQRAMALGNLKAQGEAYKYNMNQIASGNLSNLTDTAINLAGQYVGSKLGGSSKGGSAKSSKGGGANWGMVGALGGAGMDIIDNVATQGKYGKKQTTAGGVLNQAGNAAIMTGNPYAIVGGIAAKGIGTVLNLGFGETYNDEGIADIEQKNAEARSSAAILGKAKTTDDLISSMMQLKNTRGFDKNFIGDEGWWATGVTKKFNELMAQKQSAEAYQSHAIANASRNVAKTQKDLVMGKFAAFGGPIETPHTMGGGALDYSLAMDLINTKRQNIQNKNQMTNVFAGTPGSFFALGGDTQTNGADWSTGLMHINAGKSHEENPNEGVQLGVDNEGTPNLVEEGETVFDDYVFSNRIYADGSTLQKFHLPKKAKLTYADISKRLEKEIKERENDPISQSGFRANMHILMDEQERQKQEMEAQRAKEAFEALSPEEQTAIMQRAAQEEQATQQQAVMEQQAAMRQPSLEEIAMAQQQQQEYDVGQQPQMFAKGGKLYEKLFDAVGVHTAKGFKDWAKKNNVAYFADLDKDGVDLDSLPWDKLLTAKAFQEALAKSNPALADAMKNGYNFGLYQAPATGSKVYDWDNFWEPINEYSKQTGNSDNKYRIDSSYKGKVKDLEGSDDYKAFTDYILNNATDDERMNYFKWIDENTGRKNKYITDGKLADNWKDMYTSARNDGLYGIQHYTPSMIEAARGAQAGNYVINDDGTIEQWYGDVPADFTSAGNFAWQGKDSDFARNYYRKPAATAEASEASAVNTEKSTNDPIHRVEWPRYAGLFGPAVGLGMMAAGIGRPDTASIDAAVEGAGDVRVADYKPLGNYLTYRPLDIWYEQNRLNANARATDRAILNSGANQGSKMAGLLAAGYNDQIASGNLFRQAQEYNDVQREKVASFNRGTDQFNSEQYGATSRFNAGAWNDASRAARQLRLQAASQKADMDAGWYNSLYGNISGLFKGLSDLGTENYRMNRISELAADDVFGHLGKSNTGKTVIKENGGKAKRKKNKRGLTF